MDMYGNGNVRSLGNELTRQHEQKMLEAQTGSYISNKRNVIKLSIFGVFSFFALIFAFQIISAHASVNKINAQIQSKSASINVQKNRTTELNQKVKQLNDRDYVEKIIRDKYYFTKPGETVYSFPSQVARDVK